MRILAIRGRNLASLAEPFELDFTAEPLAGAGLFTIIGETGAGKSTILDALCLALYGEFPRLKSGEGSDKLQDAGGEGIEVHDPRSILRTGAVEATAEVVLGIGDARLLARWQVRRARGKADGRLQPAERNLVDLATGDPIASGKTNVEREITERIGLSYDQFRRTVLLAQNQFDAFLRASDAERAELLERITGTEMYSRLSTKAFESEVAARQQLDELRRAGEAIALMPDDERAQLTAGVAAAETERGELEQGAATLRAVLDRHARQAEAEQRVAEAERLAAEASAAIEAVAEERATLARLQQLEPLRALWQRAEDAANDLQHRQEELAARSREADELQHRQQEAAAELQAGEARLAAAAGAEARARPQIEAALKLDQRIELEAAREAEQRQAVRALKAQADEAAAALQALEAELSQSESRRTGLAGESERQAGLAPLAAVQGEIGAAFERLREHIAAAATAETLLKQCTGERDRLAARVAADRARREQLAKDLAAAKQNESETAKILAALKPDELRERRDRLAVLRDALQALARHLELEAERRRAITDADAAAETAASAQAAARAAATRLEGELRQTEARSQEADEQLARSQTILSEAVLRLRADLVDGEACPVCGSSEHPGHADEVVRRLVADLRQRRMELAEARTTIETNLAAERERAGLASARRDGALGEKKTAGAKLAELEKRRPGLVSAAAKAAKALRAFDIPKGAGADEIAALAARSNDDIGVLDASLGKARLAEAERQRAAEKVLTLEADLAAVAQDGAAAEAEWQRLQQEATVAETALAAATERCEATLEPLALRLAPCGIARADLERDAPATARRVDRVLAAYRQLQQELAAVEAQLAELRPRRTGLAERARLLATRHADEAAKLAALAAGLAGLRQERAGLLDGRPAAAEREALAAALAEARQQVADAGLSGRELAARLAELQRAVARQQPEVARRQGAADKLAAARDAGLAQAGLDAEGAAALMAVSHDEREQLAGRIAALQQQAGLAAAQLADRRRHAEDVKSELADATPADALRQQLAGVSGRHSELGEQLGRDRQRLADDDRARQKRSGLAAEIAAAETEHRRWEAVSAAIGSRSGDKFRRFVQGVTLDHLVGLANEQLKGINPRYEIERSAEGGLSLQVVDLEMGGERRSVRSLSGGERFLVSLALALSLSQLDGRGGYVDTLLIDEGFGALDARSLDMAVEALERLQSEGRRVGVISHVEALKERIPVQVVVEKQGDGRSRVRVGMPDYGF